MIDLTQGALRIRSAREEDAPLLNRWWNDGGVMAHAGFPRGLHQPLEDTLHAVRGSLSHGGTLCILEVEGAPVGECSLPVRSGEGRPGWKICEADQQNRGYGPRFIRMTMDYLFSNPEVTRVVWDTMADNARARKVYDRLPGVRCLGVLPAAWQDQLGVWRDGVGYELTREAWQQWSKA